MKIGFIAMSGVRAHNTELTALGLTLPGFVERNKIIASLPSLGLLTLAALTPDRFEVDYQEIADLKQTPSLPEDYDLVAISSYSAQISEAYQLADEYRKKGVPVVMGGLHVSALPDEAKAHCTSVVVERVKYYGPNYSPTSKRATCLHFIDNLSREVLTYGMLRCPVLNCSTRKNITGSPFRPAEAARTNASSVPARF
jgi:hypothetical protein